MIFLKILLIFIFLFVGSITWAASILLGTIEIGQALPSPLNCLTYMGKSPDTIALYSESCEDIRDNWIYIPKENLKYMITLYGYTYQLVPIFGTGIEVRRLP